MSQMSILGRFVYSRQSDLCVALLLMRQSVNFFTKPKFHMALYASLAVHRVTNCNLSGKVSIVFTKLKILGRFSYACQCGL